MRRGNDFSHVVSSTALGLYRLYFACLLVGLLVLTLPFIPFLALPAIQILARENVIHRFCGIPDSYAKGDDVEAGGGV